LRLALFEPDIPQNAGALIRLGACLGVAIDIIEPCGFLWSDAKLRRAVMDYLDRAEIVRHASWQEYLASLSGRLILLTTRAERFYIDFMFEKTDTLMLGRESAGVPDHVHQAAHARLRIPMQSGLRALNVGHAGAMALGEALRQTNNFPQ
jgi:tRNA (cytidine/uridine-2'-O-)-methyltransferase